MPRPVPAALEDALAADPAARDRFWALPPEQKDGWIAYVDRARLPRARRRRAREVAARFGAREEQPAGAAAAPLPRDDWAVWLVGLALLLGLAAFLVWLTVFRDDGGSKPNAVVVSAKTTVPTVTGIRYQAAQFQLKDAKLASTLTRRNASKPKGIVIEQKPDGGATVPQGTRVALVVSNGPPGVAMPDVVGLAAADAVKALQERKLRPTLEQTASSEAPGTVVAQTPKAGKRARPGSEVVLQVAEGASAQPTTSSGTTTAAAAATTTTARSGLHPPAHGNDYTGMTLEAAVRKIAQGRQQAIVEYVASTEPAGTVVANSAAGSRERLRVSAGAQPQPAAQVPDVNGADSATAEQTLQGAGFSVLEVSWPVSESAPEDVVVFETPRAGTGVPQGSAVVVYVAAHSG
jgi:beta-lactam-binding protein with PASTA domain